MTLAARAAADLAGDTLTAIYDALRPADGMPTRAQLVAFSQAAGALWDTICNAQNDNRAEEQEQSA